MTHLLDSWMRAMAMRILVRRKMMVRRRIASTTDIIITEEEGGEKNVTGGFYTVRHTISNHYTAYYLS